MVLGWFGCSGCTPWGRCFYTRWAVFLPVGVCGVRWLHPVIAAVDSVVGNRVDNSTGRGRGGGSGCGMGWDRVGRLVRGPSRWGDGRRV